MKNLLFTLALLISFGSFGQIATESMLEEYRTSYRKALRYFESGNDKFAAKDYYGAISDFTKAIELNPNYTDAYSNRGISKENLGDLNGACADWKKAAALGHKNSTKWVANQCN